MRLPFFTHWRLRRELHDSAMTALVISNAQLHEQMKELTAMNRRRELLVVAAQHFANVFDNSNLANDEQGRFNNREMQALTELLRSAGHHQAADVWQSYHVPDDEDADHFNAESVSN